jgi:hypothetical protein
MPHAARSVRFAASIVVLALLLTPAGAGAQTAHDVRSPGRPPAPTPTEATLPADIGAFAAFLVFLAGRRPSPPAIRLKTSAGRLSIADAR